MFENSSEMRDVIASALKTNWGLFLFQGIVMLVLGIAALIAPATATVAVDFYIGWLFVISGIFGIISLFSLKDAAAFFWMLVTSALGLVAGILLIWHPAAGAVTLTVVLVAYFVVEGVFQIGGAFSYRDVVPNSWGWMVISGVADLILAAIIVFDWPVSTAWALGLIVGVNLITSGAAIVFAALESRSIAHALMRAA